jgi:hypothetical protein
MIIQYNVSLWIQLTPDRQISALFPHKNVELNHSTKKDCFLLSDALRNMSDHSNEDFNKYSFKFDAAWREKLGTFEDNIVEMEQISIIYSNISLNSDGLISKNTCANEKCDSIKQVVKFMWYRHWEDFSIPRYEDYEVRLRYLGIASVTTIFVLAGN